MKHSTTTYQSDRDDSALREEVLFSSNMQRFQLMSDAEIVEHLNEARPDAAYGAPRSRAQQLGLPLVVEEDIARARGRIA